MPIEERPTEPAGNNGPRGEPRPTVSLVAAVLGFFVVTLDTFVVNVALPAIGRQMGTGMAGLQWIIDGYTLMFAALLLSSGALSDRFGARRAFGLGVAVFVAASAACGLSRTLGVLVAARLVQGAGAAVMLPSSLALIREAYHDDARRGHAIAIWATGGAAASAAGPIVGGFLTLISWRLIFYVNLPVGIIMVLLLARVPRSPQRAVPFDWIGQVAAIVGMGGLTYGLIEGGARGFADLLVVSALSLAVVALTTLVVSQLRGTHPMVPPRLFRSAPVVVSLWIGFAFVVGFYGLVFLLSLYLQQVRGLSSSATGLAFVPMTVLGVFVTPFAARIAARIGARVQMAIGQFLMAAGLIGLSFAAAGAPVAVVMLLTVAVGLGGPFAIPTMTAMLVGSVPADLVGTASGVLNTFRQFGGALAIAVFGALIAHSGDFLRGMAISLWVAAVLLAAGGVAALSLRSQRHDRT